MESIKNWLRENYEKNIKSVSFLLHKEHGFKQAPYQEITGDTYFKSVEKIKMFGDSTSSTQDLIDGIECEGGACPVR